MCLYPKCLFGKHDPGSLKIWTALVLAAVPTFLEGFSTYKQGTSYIDFGWGAFRSMPFIELSIFVINLCVYVRWFRRQALLKYLLWSATFLVVVVLGLGCMKLLKSPADLENCLSVAGVILMDFTSAISFGIAYRLVKTVVRQRKTGA